MEKLFKENQLYIIMNQIFRKCILLINMKEAFKIIEGRDMEFLLWVMEIGMKENFKKIFIMEKVFIIGQMTINMKVNLKIIKGKDKENLLPLMVKYWNAFRKLISLFNSPSFINIILYYY